MRKVNNRGFTLVELLVTITIMGIITMLALPEVQQLQSKNRNKKFLTYGDSLIDSAKLYVDSNSVDLFGYSTSGCADISYEELKVKVLAKDYMTDNISCADPQTYVHVERKNGVDSYKVFLKCSGNGRVRYQSENPITCTGGGSSDPTGSFTATVTGTTESSWLREREVKIKLTSTEGFAAGTMMTYYLSTDAAGSSQVAGTSSAVSFGNAAGVKELEKTINVQGVSGRLYFILKPLRVVDIKGASYTDNVVSNQMLFDNNPPKLKSAEQVMLKHGLIKYQHVTVDFEENESGTVKWTYYYPDDSNIEKEYRFGAITYLANTWCQNDSGSKSSTCNNEYHWMYTSPFTIKATNKRVIIRAYDAVGNVGSIETYVTIK